jgi:hypothetical protein
MGVEIETRVAAAGRNEALEHVQQFVELQGEATAAARGARIAEGTVALAVEPPGVARLFRLDVDDGGEDLGGFDQRRQALCGDFQRPGAGDEQAMQVATRDGLAARFEGFAVADG